MKFNVLKLIPGEHASVTEASNAFNVIVINSSNSNK